MSESRFPRDETESRATHCRLETEGDEAEQVNVEIDFVEEQEHDAVEEDQQCRELEVPGVRDSRKLELAMRHDSWGKGRTEEKCPKPTG